MDRKYKISFAMAVLSAALIGCSSNKIKVEEAKPNPLPKLAQAKSLVPVFSQNVSSTDEADPLRLRLAVDNGVIFAVDPKGEVAAFRGKQRLWQTRVSKQGLSAGAEAADGVVVVGNRKGQLFALEQATGKQLWTAQLSGALLSPSLIQAGRVITVAMMGMSLHMTWPLGKRSGHTGCQMHSLVCVARQPQFLLIRVQY